MSARHVLRGKRYELRELRPEDVTEEYVAWLHDPEVTRFLEVRFNPPSLPEQRDYVAGFDGERARIWGIYPLDSESYVGVITLHVDAHHRTGYSGYLIGNREWWGKGAAVEAMELVLDFGFDELALRRMHAGAYATNIGSVFNLKRLGYTLEGTLRRHVLDGGTPRDVVVYGILAEEWESRRGRATP